MPRYHSRTKRRKRVSGHKSHGKRRRVGAARGSGMHVFQLLIGATLGTFVGRFAYTSVTGLPAYAVQITEVLVGGAIAVFMGNEPILQGAGIGLASQGLLQTAEEAVPGLAGVLPSAGFGPAYKKIAGFRDVPSVGELFPKPAQVGKTEAMMSRANRAAYM